MIYNPYEIMGVSADFTRDMLEDAYHSRRDYLRDKRFESGQAGEDAAEQLELLERAYKDLLVELDRRNVGSGYDSYAGIKESIKNGDYEAAQATLDSFEKRDAEWHYVQSTVFFKKNWFVEAKKQLELAISMDPTNTKYRDSLDKLTRYLASNSVSPDMLRTTTRPAGGTGNIGNGTCTGSCCGDVCLANLCANCLCGGCGG